jgi:hypothetical protein
MYLYRGSENFSFPRATLDIRIFVEGRKKNNVVDSKRTYQSIACIHFKTGNGCISQFAFNVPVFFIKDRTYFTS